MCIEYAHSMHVVYTLVITQGFKLPTRYRKTVVVVRVPHQRDWLLLRQFLRGAEHKRIANLPFMNLKEAKEKTKRWSRGEPWDVEDEKDRKWRDNYYKQLNERHKDVYGGYKDRPWERIYNQYE